MEEIDSEAGPSVCLVYKDGDKAGKTFAIHEGNNLLGRWDPDTGSFPDIDLEPVDPDAKISRKHAIIDRSGKKLEIEDLNSLNGTFINRGERLRAGIRHELRHDDELIVGKSFFLVQISD